MRMAATKTDRIILEKFSFKVIMKSSNFLECKQLQVKRKMCAIDLITTINEIRLNDYNPVL